LKRRQLVDRLNGKARQAIGEHKQRIGERQTNFPFSLIQP